MRKRILGAVIAVLVIPAALLAYAPYLPQLFLEGFPELVWSPTGHYAQVAGTDQPRDIGVREEAMETPIEGRLAVLFTQSQGAALLMAQNGELVFEHYREGIDAETRLNSYSMAKSLVGALIFKAMAEDRIDSLDTPLSTFLPANARIGAVSLRALLTMRADIDFNPQGAGIGAAYSGKDGAAVSPFGPLARLHFLGIEGVERELAANRLQTGSFNYQNINTALLGKVLETIYARPLEELLAEKIWQPAGAAPALWRTPDTAMSVSAYCCIYATARDWIRVGLFLAENGSTGAPFLPEALWREFLGLDLDASALRQDHYGYHVRQNILDRPGEALQGAFSYFLGQNGQTLYLMPERNLVVYRAGEGLQLLHSTLYEVWKETH